jgi:hypothetical protein
MALNAPLVVAIGPLFALVTFCSVASPSMAIRAEVVDAVVSGSTPTAPCQTPAACRSYIWLAAFELLLPNVEQASLAEIATLPHACRPHL